MLTEPNNVDCNKQLQWLEIFEVAARFVTKESPTVTFKNSGTGPSDWSPQCLRPSALSQGLLVLA